MDMVVSLHFLGRKYKYSAIISLSFLSLLHPDHKRYLYTDKVLNFTIFIYHLKNLY